MNSPLCGPQLLWILVCVISTTVLLPSMSGYTIHSGRGSPTGQANAENTAQAASTKIVPSVCPPSRLASMAILAMCGQRLALAARLGILDTACSMASIVQHMLADPPGCASVSQQSSSVHPTWPCNNPAVFLIFFAVRDGFPFCFNLRSDAVGFVAPCGLLNGDVFK